MQRTLCHISFWILINNFYLILLVLLLMVLVSTFASSFRKFFTKCSTWLKQVLANLILQVCKYRVVLMRGSWKLLNKIFVLASFYALTIRQQWPLLIGLFSWNSSFSHYENNVYLFLDRPWKPLFCNTVLSVAVIVHLSKSSAVKVE